jgi:hypothetical protein
MSNFSDDEWVELISKSLANFSGTTAIVTVDGRLRDFGVDSQDEIVGFKRIVVENLYGVAPVKPNAPMVMSTFAISPNSTIRETLTSLQGAYSLGLAGDPIPPKGR